MLQVGDRVQPWCRLWRRRWSFNVPAGMIVEEINGPMVCECAHFRLECDCASKPDRAPYYYVRTSLLPPYNHRAHDGHYRVCAIPGRPWQMRRAGTALVLLERAAPAPQGELFA